MFSIAQVLSWRLGHLADRVEGGQSGPKIISDVVPLHIAADHADRCLCILETVPRGWSANVQQHGFGLRGPFSCFFFPSRDECLSLISEGSGPSALPVLLIDAFSECIALFQLRGASRAWPSDGCLPLGGPRGELRACVRNFCRTLAQGRIFSGCCLG